MNSKASAPSRTTCRSCGQFGVLEGVNEEVHIVGVVLDQQDFRQFVCHNLVESPSSDGEIKRCAFFRLALRPDATAVAVNDALHDGQAHARAFKLLRAVQPLENTETVCARIPSRSPRRCL